MLLPKPPACASCPLYGNGLGWVSPEGSGALGVLIMGEAAGANERDDGLPFRPYAQAGSLLERVIKGCGYSRQQFRIANVLQCQPPRDWLDGAPYEIEAISCCNTHRNAIVSQFRPKVILALGAIPLRVLTGMVGEKRGISLLRGYCLPAINYDSIPVISSFHPSFIRRGKGELQAVLAHDLRLAVEVAQGAYKDFFLNPTRADMPGYILHPSLDDARSYALKVRENQGAILAYDIETPRSSGVEEDDADVEELEHAITQVQFSTKAGEAICLPWQGAYIDVARDLLAQGCTKAGHNVWRFDNPRLEAAGCAVNGTVHDTMQMWRHLQPDLPASLQFVASFYKFPFPWKHLSGSDEAFYGCCDVDAVSRIMAAAPSQLGSQRIDSGYSRHRLGLEPVLVDMARRGIPVDDAERLKLEAAFEADRAALDAEIQALVPEELKPLKTYKTKPSVRLPFLPNSSKQLLSYIKARGHKVPKHIKKGTDTTEAKELARLAKATKDPLYAKIVEWRNLDKMLGTYVTGWEPGRDRRVHPQFFTETGTGQLNSRRPNGQNFPRRGALAKQMRRMICAEEGHRLIEFDYRAFHALTLGFEAKDKDYMRLAKLDIHSFVASQLLRLGVATEILGQSDGDLSNFLCEVRTSHSNERDNKAKPAILGIGFGLGERKLYDMNREFFASQKEAKAVRDLIRGLFPRVFEWQDEIRELAHRQTFLRSRYGYIRHFYDVYHYDGNSGRVRAGEDSEAAIAFLPANDAFGMIKEAMLRLDARGLLERYGLINQIHDALMFHCPEPLVEECLHTVKEEMERPSEVLVDAEVAPGGLSVAVEAKVGRNWASMEAVSL